MADSKFLTVQPDQMLGDANLCHVVKASAINGGFTVVAAHASTGLAGTIDLVLQNYGTTGTVAGGTVAGRASGTATVWVADVPQSLTLTAANVYIDAGEWLVLKKLEAGASDDLTVEATVTIEYVDGPVLVG